MGEVRDCLTALKKVTPLHSNGCPKRSVFAESDVKVAGEAVVKLPSFHCGVLYLFRESFQNGARKRPEPSSRVKDPKFTNWVAPEQPGHEFGHTGVGHELA